MDAGIAAINDRVREGSGFAVRLREEIATVIVGQRALVDRLLIGLLTNGHVLLEGVPGLAKTLAVKTLAQAIQASFRRVQFTPDLLPADLIGTLVYNPREGSFTTKRDPFLVLATQNPIEQEGTYPLPEAQVDRFMLKLRVEYPSREEERQILDRMATTANHSPANPVVTTADIIAARALVDQVYVDDKVRDYIVSIVFATREPKTFSLDLGPLVEYGASPRATLCLTLAARAHAFLQGRGYVTPQDVKAIAPDVLRHRVIVSYEAEAEEVDADEVVRRVLDGVPVP